MTQTSQTEQPLEITVQDLKSRLDAGERILLVDVREDWEHAIGHIAGARLIPLGTVPERHGELPRDEEIVVYCHHGRRSLEAVQFMRANGVPCARSLAGGIDAWSLEIDPSISRY